MRSVADDLRRDALAMSRSLSPTERVELAFRLGDADAELHAAAHGVSRDEAVRVFRRQRQAGRRPSRCAGES